LNRLKCLQRLSGGCGLNEAPTANKEPTIMRVWIGSLILTALVAVFGMSRPAPAQDYWEASAASDATAISTASIDAIMKRVEALEAKADDTKKDAKKDEKKADEWKDVSEEKWTFKLGGRVHADYVMYANQNAGNQARFGDLNNYFEWRRLRLEAEGQGYGVYMYRVQLDFESEGTAALPDSGDIFQDVYFGVKEVPWFGTVIIGKSKQPISLELLTSSNNMTFMERSLPQMFLGDPRRIGIHAANYVPSEVLNWDYGVFFAPSDAEDHEIISDNPGVRTVGRVATSPYYCEGGRYLLHFGLGGAWQTTGEDNLWRWRSRPELHEGPFFVDSGLFDSRSFYTLDFESAVNWGALSLQSELFYNRNAAAAGDIDLYGAYAEASWFLTGEARGYNRSRGVFDRVTPFTNFWLVRTNHGVDAGWGAWQLAARWSAIDASDAAFRGRDRGMENDTTLGVNWYWNPNIRWMLNWTHAWNSYEQAVRGYTDGQADILAVRGQLTY
jgi:phosphate-selective porin OprO and OprP